LMLLAILVVCLVLVVVFNLFVREIKDEMVPLCPSLVKDTMRFMRLPINTDADSFDVTDTEDSHMCSVKIEWSDPFKEESQDAAARASIRNSKGIMLAQVIAQFDGVVGYELRLCRASKEPFGFVRAESETKYHVGSRLTNTPIMTLDGDFEEYAVDGFNPAGALICSIRVREGKAVCMVLEYIDAGLILSVLLAVHIHRRLTSGDQSMYATDLMSVDMLESPAASLVMADAAPEDIPAECPLMSETTSPLLLPATADAAPAEAAPEAEASITWPTFEGTS